MLPTATVADSYALVVGNASYEPPFAPLASPAKDAARFEAAFTELGFSVEVLLDADHAQFDAALTDMQGKVAEGDTVAVVYSGNGWRAQGVDYLMPIDAGNEASLLEKSIPLRNGETGVLDRLRATPADLVVVISDAGRSELSAPMIKRRIALPDSLAEYFLIQSTSPGGGAIDGQPDDGGSPFARSLAPLLTQKIGLEEAVGLTQTSVAAKGSKSEGQRPTYEDGTFGLTCLIEQCVD